MESIEELARLLTEQKRVDEKLEETQTSLSCIRKEISESLALASLNGKEEPPYMDEGLVQKEQTFERLLQALQDMKGEVQAKIRPLEEQIVQANINNLLEVHASEVDRLESCLNAIDQTIIDCRSLVDKCAKSHEELSILNEKISRFGAEPLPIANSVSSNEIEKTLRQRIEHLRLQGKL